MALFLTPDFIQQEIASKFWYFLRKHNIKILYVYPLNIKDNDVIFLYNKNIKLKPRRNPDSIWLSTRLFQSGTSFLILLKGILSQEKLKNIQGKSTEDSLVPGSSMRRLSSLMGRCFSMVHIPDNDNDLRREVDYFLGDGWPKSIIQRNTEINLSEFNKILTNQTLTTISCQQQILPNIILRVLLFIKYNPFIPNTPHSLNMLIDIQEEFFHCQFDLNGYFMKHQQKKEELGNLFIQLTNDLNKYPEDYRSLKKKSNAILLTKILEIFLFLNTPNVHLSEMLLDVIKINLIPISLLEEQLFLTVFAFK